MEEQFKKIKILFLSRWYPHRNDPMLGLFVQRHAESVARNCDVIVLYVQDDADMTGKTFDTESFYLNDVNTLIVYYKKRTGNFLFSGKIINIISFLKAYKKGWEVLRKQHFNPDIIHANILTRTGIIALYLKIFKKIPYIITEHWSRYLNNSLSYKGFFRKLFTRIVVKRASAITTVTSNLKEAMRNHKLKNKNYYVIPNVVDVDIFVPSVNKTRYPKKTIIHLSCFEDVSKNISGIIRSAKRLSHIRQDFEIRLVGDGIDKLKLEKLAEEEGVKDHFVFFDGLLEGQKLVDKINTAEFMIMFSNYENLPVVILEAFACGLPVLSTDVGGIAGHLNEERGILTEAGNEEAFTDRLNDMLNHYEDYDRDKIREYAVRHFSKETVGTMFTAVYRQVLDRQE